MEVPGGHNNKTYVLLYEFLGTAVLLFAINASQSGPFPPLAIGIGLFVGASMFGPVSGGHFNPAVSIGVFIKEGNSNE